VTWTTPRADVEEEWLRLVWLLREVGERLDPAEPEALAAHLVEVYMATRSLRLQFRGPTGAALADFVRPSIESRLLASAELRLAAMRLAEAAQQDPSRADVADQLRRALTAGKKNGASRSPIYRC